MKMTRQKEHGDMHGQGEENYLTSIKMTQQRRHAVKVAKASNYKFVNKEHGDMHGQAYEKQLNRLVK